ncbi:MAG: hypothetical protein EON54_03815 [Alcaligenaceae bacterium]|nr:MAG: hypothetical protein EON54_03815 [Alcaligenaceae bacterium]
MKVKLIACGLAAATFSLYSATASAEVMHLGVRSCGQWVKARSAKGPAAMYYENWVAGYMSGLAAGTDKDFLNGMDEDSIMLWIDNYCQANPLESVPGASLKLGFQLAKKKKL